MSAEAIYERQAHHSRYDNCGLSFHRGIADKDYHHRLAWEIAHGLINHTFIIRAELNAHPTYLKALRDVQCTLVHDI